MANRYSGLRAAFTLLLFLANLSATTAWAQYFAAPGGSGAPPCDNPDNPCRLAFAVREAMNIPGSTIYIQLADAINPTASFTENEAENLTGIAAINADVIFDTYLDAARRIPNAVIILEGDVSIGAGVYFSFAGDLTFELTGNKTLTLSRKATIPGLRLLRFSGEDALRVVLDTGNDATHQTVDLSSLDLVIDMQGEAGSVTFDAVGAGRGLASLTLGDLLIADADEVVITEGLLALAVEDFVQITGRFSAGGAMVSVGGDFVLGSPSSVAWFEGEEATFRLDVAGSFTVFPDANAVSANPEDRNRFYLAGGTLTVAGSYDFQGTADRWEDSLFVEQAQGLDGTVILTGAEQQTVSHRQDEDAYFNDIILNGAGGILLQSDVFQNDTGTLTLEDGIIDSNEEQWTWTTLNPGFESDLAGRNNSAPGKGVVQLGSRHSYLDGKVTRRVERSGPPGQPWYLLGSYLFPVGLEVELSGKNRHVFRPLILQFPGDLGRPTLARVDYRQDLTPENCEWPEGGLVVDAVSGPRGEPGGTLTLDVLSNQFWQLEFDQIPPLDPNIRIEADELANVFEISALRLIQWDCGCINPRLAGVYMVPDDFDSFYVINDFIDSVPNIGHEDLNVETCQIIGIASNFLINQINLPESPKGLARVQIIHNASDAGPLDVYIDNNRYLDDALFQTGTPFMPVLGGTHTIAIVAGADADNSNPILSQELTVFNQVNYVIVAHGLINPGAGEPAFRLAVKDNVRLRSTDDDSIDFFFIHGWPQLGLVDILEFDPVNYNDVVGVWADDFDFDDVGAYLSLDAGVGHNIAITNADHTVQYAAFQFELQAKAGEAMAFIGSGLGTSQVEGVTLMVVLPDGSLHFPTTVGNEPDRGAGLPQTFTLHSNYPNPFNPTTTIRFDLPETAWITVEVVDLLGRTVLTTPAQQREAGSNRTVALDASGLASGLYLYRVRAQTAQNTQLRTGRMTVIK